jgi:hypothetical protein
MRSNSLTLSGRICRNVAEQSKLNLSVLVLMTSTPDELIDKYEACSRRQTKMDDGVKFET